MYYIDIEDIKEWFPALAEPYEAWGDQYNDNFKINECDKGSGSEVFLDLKDRVRWATEGLLLAAWLVLQVLRHQK